MPVEREKLADWCEKGILALVLALLVTGPLLFGGSGQAVALGGNTGSGHFLPLQLLTLAAAVLWGLRLWLAPRAQILWPPVCWAVVAFTLYALARYCFADVEYAARQEVTSIVVYALLFFVVLNNLHRQESTRAIALTMVFLGMAVSFYAAYQVFAKNYHVWDVAGAYPGRATGTFPIPNSLAGFLAMVLPLGVAYLLAGRLSHLTKVLVGYAALVMLAAVALTASRGGMVAAGVALLALCVALLTQRNYRIQAALVLAVLLGLVYYAAPRIKAVQTRFTGASSGNLKRDMRIFIWESAFDIWKDHPVLGVGPGLFDTHFRLYQRPEMQTHPVLVHNDYLNTLTDYGVAGAVCVLAAFVLIFAGVAGSWRDVRGARDDFARKRSSKFAFLLGASAALVAMLVHSVVDFDMHIPACAFLAVTLMALLSSQWRFTTERYWITAGLGIKRLVSVILLVVIAGLGWSGWRGAREAHWLRLADRTPPFSLAQIEALKQAWAADPQNYETTFAIAERYHAKSRDSATNSVGFARSAMKWYRRGMELNPRDGYNWLGYGMCLDRIGMEGGRDREDSWPYYRKANELSPNDYLTTAKTGWHFSEMYDFAAARTWFERSRRLEWLDNLIADSYLPLMDQALRREAGATE